MTVTKKRRYRGWRELKLLTLGRERSDRIKHDAELVSKAMDERVIRIADFTKYPTGYERENGNSSKEILERTMLCNLVYAAFCDNKTFTIDLDGTRGYPASFLQHLFMSIAIKLGRYKLHSCLLIKSLDEPYLPSDVWAYIDECPD